jgi:trans-aconitate 2-methyltransferase
VSRQQYLFGDSNIAAQRLKLLASVYQDSTREFLVDAAGRSHFELALDLGCGPGFTTRLIADSLRCHRVIGLEASAGYVELARANAGERIAFVQHDVTAIPFPSGPANLIFSRFLLTHLRDPAAAVANWVTQLQPGGILLSEETEEVHSIDPTFARYLRIVEAMLAANCHHLYAGRLVAGLNLPAGLKTITSEHRRIAVRNCDAARMFTLNLGAWKDNEFVRTNYSCQSILELKSALAEISASESSARDIEWELRQAAWIKS